MATLTKSKQPEEATTASARRGKAGQSQEDIAAHSKVIARVPDASVADQYVSRLIPMGQGQHMEDLDLLDWAFASGFNVLIEGPTGPGKTMFTRAWCASRKRKLARVPSNVGIDKSALFGKFVPDKEKGGFTWVDGAVTHVVREGGAILINEVNFIPERIATVLFGLLDDAREIVLDDKDGEIVRAHRATDCWCSLSKKDCRKRQVLIVADMNPDYLGTRGLNAAFRNRWELQLTWNYDTTVEKQLIPAPHLLDMATQLRDQHAKGEIETPVSTNMLMEFLTVAEGLTLDFAITNFVAHFATEERDSVKLVCDTHRANIENDLNDPVYADAEDEDGGLDVGDDVDDWLMTEG